MVGPKILTPVDGSPASLCAVDFALEMLSCIQEVRSYYST